MSTRTPVRRVPRSVAGALLLTAGLAGLPACGGGGDPVEARQPSDRFRVLVFSKTTGYRHASIPAGVDAIRGLGRRHRFAVDHTEDARRFSGRVLARYDALIFLSTTGEPLSGSGQQRALRRYIGRGGGFLGVHAASDSHYRWPWYVGLVGASFRRHAPGTPAATVVVEDRSTPATRRLPRRWQRRDEWYAFRENPRARVHVLARLDERSYDPVDSAMGGDHPIAWCHRYAGGRAVYTAMGHTAESYAEPRFLDHLLGSIRMAAGDAPFECPPSGA